MLSFCLRKTSETTEVSVEKMRVKFFEKAQPISRHHFCRLYILYRLLRQPV